MSIKANVMKIFLVLVAVFILPNTIVNATKDSRKVKKFLHSLYMSNPNKIKNKIKKEDENEELKELKKLYEEFCDEIMEFDKNYAYESMALREINETYSYYFSKIIVQNLVEDDLSYNGYDVSSTYRNLDGLFRTRASSCIAYPYNRIEEYEAAVFNSLNLLKDKFEELNRFFENMKDKKLRDGFFYKILPKNKITIKDINDKYEKYLKLSKNVDENKGVLNSNTVFLYFSNIMEDNDCDIYKTTDFLSFYSTKILVNVKAMDLETKDIKTVEDEFSKLLRDFSEEEINALKIFDVMKKLQKEVFVRNRAFEFIFKLGKITELYAEKHICSLHRKGSIVDRIKQIMNCPEGGSYWWESIQRLIDKNRYYDDY